MNPPTARLKVGTYTDGDLTVAVTIEPRLEVTPTSGEVQTVDHELLDTSAGLLRFAIMGDTRENGREGSGGQIVNELAKVTKFAPGWDAERRDEAVRLWETWHLNDMKAACAHQRPVGDTVAERLDSTPECPESGYRFGSAWLVEPLTESALADIHRVFGITPPS